MPSPPAGWKPLYMGIRSIRQQLLAPVDQIGCDKLFDPKAKKAVQHYQILLSLMLSSQTKDAVTAEAMRKLLLHGCTVEKIQKTEETTVAELIYPVSFYRNKARYIKQTTDIIHKDHDCVVPDSYDELIALPGLGPKMIHLFLQSAYGRCEGIGVDVHVHRISQRLGWVPRTVKGPEDTRKALESWLPREYWSDINGMLVGFGQTVCTPRNPQCGNCDVRNLCPNAFKEGSAGKSQSPQEQPKKNKASLSASSLQVNDLEDLLAKPPRKRSRT